MYIQRLHFLYFVTFVDGFLGVAVMMGLALGRGRKGVGFALGRGARVGFERLSIASTADDN